MSSKHIHKSHNVSLLLYHLVCPAKYRRKVFTGEVETTLKNVCFEIEQRYEIHFVEIGVDEDHVHFLIQSVPTYSPKQIAQTIKSITAKEIFRLHPEVKKLLWGGKFWTSGYYINTEGRFGNEESVKQYVHKQSMHYKKIYRTDTEQQMSLFGG